MPFPRLPSPEVACVAQHLPTDHISGVRQHTCKSLLEAGLRTRVARGARIAITAGSRGMGGLVELVAGIADAIREVGASPFVVPAMGSHGGALPEGQVEILRRLGVTEEAVGAAQQAAMKAIRPGTRAADVDGAARELLTARGYGVGFKHPTGHGVGFAAVDHDALPRLHLKSPDVLEAGMVFNVEPAVYFEGYGGLRHCDMVAVTAAGAEVLTPSAESMRDLPA